MDSYVVSYYVPLVIKEAPRFTYCSCVEFAKWTLGRQGETWGNAWNQKPTHQSPQIGDAILTTDGRGHEGVVIATDGKTVTFIEANWRPCAVTKRTLPLESKTIRGYR